MVMVRLFTNARWAVLKASSKSSHGFFPCSGLVEGIKQLRKSGKHSAYNLVSSDKGAEALHCGGRLDRG